MKDLEKTLKVLANRRRLSILKYLREEHEANVTQIADKINLSLKATSKHLGILLAADIVDREQRSLQMFYGLAEHQKPIVQNILRII